MIVHNIVNFYIYIYYKGDDDIYQDAVIKSDYKSSLHDINKEDQGNSENKEGQKLSGTISIGKKNINLLWYSSHIR